jgi:hypothetical protein
MADLGLGSFAASIGLEHLSIEEPLQKISLSDLYTTLDSGGGRVALLAKLKQCGVTKLTDRQKLANGLSKAVRLGGDASAAADAMAEQAKASAEKAKEREAKAKAPNFGIGGAGLRVLFLHGYGLSPSLLETLGALDGLKALLPKAHYEMLAGFERIDLAHGPTAAAFADPGNGLSTVLDFAKITGESLHCWADFSVPTKGIDPENVVERGYARESPTTMNAIADRILRHCDNDVGGGFDLVVGFSQGGEYGCIMAARLSSGTYKATKGGRMPRKFLLLGSELAVPLRVEPPLSFLPPSAAAAAPGESNEELVPVTSISSPPADAATVETSVVVVAGEKDDDAYAGLAQWAEQLKGAGLRDLTTASWPGDHRMPPTGEAVYMTALKALGLILSS